ncbi:MAG TPA: Gfo/Idh/MocA family oxidoreductase [Chthonomonadaceae bacterium]|nr:Gfo/Idh/MocA family oxidoreductase [Chthonomonadaceae bacterium]
MERVRVGIIGPSWWVDYWHLPALQGHPAAVVTAVCGGKARDPEAVRAKYGPHAAYYTDMETMLDTAPLDGVIVCTPNDLHYPATMAALRRGLHVTCEKPVALNAEQAWEMAETAQASGLIGMCNFPYRDNPAAQRLHQFLKEGAIGTPLHVTGHYYGGYGLRGRPGWRALRARSGAGILGDLGSHLIDLVRFITGDEFSRVCAHSLTVLDASEPHGAPDLLRTEDPRVGPRNDDSCAFLAEFASGAQGLLHTSWMAWQGAGAQSQQIEIYGEEGRLTWTSTHAGSLLLHLPRGAQRPEPVLVEGTVSPDPAREENEDYFRPGRHTPTNTTYRWIEAIRTGQPALSPSLKDGWRAQQVIDAVVRSSAERRWIEVT